MPMVLRDDELDELIHQIMRRAPVAAAHPLHEHLKHMEARIMARIDDVNTDLDALNGKVDDLLKSQDEAINDINDAIAAIHQTNANDISDAQLGAIRDKLQAIGSRLTNAKVANTAADKAYDDAKSAASAPATPTPAPVDTSTPSTPASDSAPATTGSDANSPPVDNSKVDPSTGVPPVTTQPVDGASTDGSGNVNVPIASAAGASGTAIPADAGTTPTGNQTSDPAVNKSNEPEAGMEGREIAPNIAGDLPSDHRPADGGLNGPSPSTSNATGTGSSIDGTPTITPVADADAPVAPSTGLFDKDAK